MKWELRRIEPVRAANLVAVFYFIMIALFSLPMYFVMGAMPTQNADAAQQESFKQTMQFFLIGYPFFGAAFSWVFTVFGAVLYNTLAPRMGGVLFDVGESSRPGVTTVA